MTFVRTLLSVTAFVGSVGALGWTGAANATMPAGPLTATSSAKDGWTTRLLADLTQVDAQSAARIGVYVRDLDTGISASYQADKSWYLASMVKVPIAIAVMRGVEAGQFALDTTVTLRSSDYVDGAGPTNSHAIGTPLSVHYLLEQMIVHSDNTASDMLIDLVGLSAVNDTVASLVPEGIRRITTLSEVRRQVYGNLVANTDRLSGPDLIVLQKLRSDTERSQMLARMVDAPPGRTRAPNLDTAYNAYYASGVNSGRLDAYAELLQKLVEGQALTPKSTSYLLALMERVATGTHRIKAGLPPNARFAHKTGTQRRRTCDAGLVRVAEAAQERRVLVVACTRDDPVLARSEFALMQVGAALCRSGLITQGIIDAPTCRPLQPATPTAVPAVAPGRDALAAPGTGPIALPLYERRDRPAGSER